MTREALHDMDTAERMRQACEIGRMADREFYRACHRQGMLIRDSGKAPLATLIAERKRRYERSAGKLRIRE